ncbi:MAG: DUF4924 family protein [Rikenellaceae bacterium]
MDIARGLRHSNIAEYVLYIWQLEDLFRGLQFSPEAIYSQFVASRHDLSPEDQMTVHGWYVELTELLLSEGKRERGHLEHTHHIIADLGNLHLQLLKLPIGARYRTLWSSFEEVLPDLRAVAGAQLNESLSDIELCFRALYGAMLYRLRGSDGRGAIEDTLAFVSPLIAELANVYHQVERGETDLFKNE